MNRPLESFLLFAIASLALCPGCDSSKPVRLLQDGRSDYVIVLHPDASPSQRHAADEFQLAFSECTGVELPIVEGRPDDDRAMIVLGVGPIARELGVDPDPEEIGLQGARIATRPPHLVIAGAPEAGTLYAVHRFLQDHLGVRWYAPGVSKHPQHTDLTLPELDELTAPAFFWRASTWERPGGDADFFARQGENSGDGEADHPQGIQFDRGGPSHTYLKLIRPDDYFDEHPEYFSQIGGVRIREETQLCLTNPDVLDIVTEKILQQMADEPDRTYFTFSQMDWYNGCECEHCTEINERYQTLGGTQFWFVNQLAERTAQLHPDKSIRTLAYMYTEEPPVGLTLHPNTALWLCHMFPSCDSHPVATCPVNADYKRRAEAWTRIADQVFVWHYNTDFAHYYVPFPNLRSVAADLRFYQDIGVDGIYLQGMGSSGGGGEFPLLRPWVMLQLVWDPNQDLDALIDDFLQAYFGNAWEPVRQYIDLLHDEVEEQDVHMHLYTNPGQGYLPDRVIDEARALFDQAERRVEGDPELLERVKVARMPLTYVRFFPRNGYRIEGDELVWQGERATYGEIQEFVDRAEAHGFQQVREQSGGLDTMLTLALMLLGDLEVIRLENPVLEVQVVPMLAGRVLRIIHKPSGQEVTAYNRPSTLPFPLSGGLEDRVGELFRFSGWVMPHTVEARDATSLTTSAETLDGDQLTRTMSLDPTEPILRVSSTVTHGSDQPEDKRLRSHLELDLGELRSTQVRFTSLDGQPVDEDMTRILAGQRQGAHYYDLDAPAGEWTLTGSKGLALTQRFDPGQVEFTWLYAYPEDLAQLELEVWAPLVTLQPGESVSLAHELEIRPVE